MAEDKRFEVILDQFQDYLSSVLKVYQDLVPVLKIELEAVSKDDINKLDDCLKSQQALLLQTKNFDSKVKEFQVKLNIAAANLSALILQLPEDRQMVFFEILHQFGQASEEVRFYQEKCRTLLQSKLYFIDKVLSESNAQKGSTYTKEAAEIQGSLLTRSLEVKI